MFNLFVVGAGGFIGTVIRYMLTKLAGEYFAFFPFGTLACNVIAGLFIGVIAGAETMIPIEPRMKIFLAAGMMGGLSTFSTFSLDTISLFQEGRVLAGSGNILLNLMLSLLGVLIGIGLARIVFVKA